MDENIDYTNLRKRQPSSKSKLSIGVDKSQYNSGSHQTSDKYEMTKKYKQDIKEKLLSGKGKREMNSTLSNEDI